MSRWITSSLLWYCVLCSPCSFNSRYSPVIFQTTEGCIANWSKTACLKRNWITKSAFFPRHKTFLYQGCQIACTSLFITPTSGGVFQSTLFAWKRRPPELLSQAKHHATSKNGLYVFSWCSLRTQAGGSRNSLEPTCRLNVKKWDRRNVKSTT